MKSECQHKWEKRRVGRWGFIGMICLLIAVFLGLPVAPEGQKKSLNSFHTNSEGS